MRSSLGEGPSRAATEASRELAVAGAASLVKEAARLVVPWPSGAVVTSPATAAPPVSRRPTSEAAPARSARETASRPRTLPPSICTCPRVTAPPWPVRAAWSTSTIQSEVSRPLAVKSRFWPARVVPSGPARPASLPWAARVAPGKLSLIGVTTWAEALMSPSARCTGPARKPRAVASAASDGRDSGPATVNFAPRRPARAEVARREASLMSMTPLAARASASGSMVPDRETLPNAPETSSVESSRAESASPVRPARTSRQRDPRKSSKKGGSRPGVGRRSRSREKSARASLARGMPSPRSATRRSAAPRRADRRPFQASSGPSPRASRAKGVRSSPARAEATRPPGASVRLAFTARRQSA